ncbi:SDR family NAD(P)-dependent oxidoreductase [Lentzea sp. NPDC060358]|uniref:SDR family NAD(P)-dependent oxidoreductase n=1 Tax=Lentzea sp. NPDC060358 TaxID=3347103 RepID=UPI00364AD2EF
MERFVVTGGTDGVGRAVVLHALGRGHSVLAVGSTEDKGRALLDAAAVAGAADRLRFLRADLRSLAENDRVLHEVAAHFPVVDTLVLGAQRYRTRWRETVDGVEENFALTYLSRFVLAHGLAGPMAGSARPLVVNLCGTGTPVGRMHWDDLQLRASRSGWKALMQAGRATDLLGVEFARRAPRGAARFVLFNPDGIRTGVQKGLEWPWGPLAHAMTTLFGKSMEAGLPPLLDLLDSPPEAALSAFRGSRPVDMSARSLARSYSAEDAARLHEATVALLDGLGRRGLAPA